MFAIKNNRPRRDGVQMHYKPDSVLPRAQSFHNHARVANIINLHFVLPRMSSLLPAPNPGTGHRGPI